MEIFGRVQGRRKFRAQEYVKYFKDLNLSLFLNPDYRGH